MRRRDDRVRTFDHFSISGDANSCELTGGEGRSFRNMKTEYHEIR